jgi:hypothetical protein
MKTSWKRLWNTEKSKSLELDIVVALPVHECARRLEVGSAHNYRRWQRARVDDDGSFIVEQLVDTPHTLQPTVQFVGTLAPVEGGTRVRGSITRQTRHWLRGQRWISAALNTASIPIVVAAASYAPGMLIPAAGYSAAAGAVALWYRVHTRRLAPDLVRWIYGLLFVPMATFQ